MKRQYLLIIAICLAALFISSCTKIAPPEKIPDKTPVSTTAELKESEATQELRKFASTEDIITYLKANQAAETQSYAVRSFAMDSMVESAAAPMADAAGAKSVVATDFSTTNIQVEGVDEADFVKNDNKYLYVLAQDKLVIVDAFPAKNAKILSETKLEGTPRDLFVNNDRLIIFTQDYDDVIIFPAYDFMPRPRSTQTTHVLVYDISDRSEPELVKDYQINGNYFQSRMIGNYVYFITKEYIYWYGSIIDTPVIRESGKAILTPDVYYFDNPEQNYVFHTITSLDISRDDDKLQAKSFLMGYSNNLYVSENNIYITYQKNFPWRWHQDYQEKRFYEAVVPLLPNSIRTQIEDIKEEDKSSYEKWIEISRIIENMYNTMDEDDKENLIEKIDKAVQEYDIRMEIEQRKTIIHKINIDRGRISYDSRGEVMGYPLNQFSMDEHNGYFRIATTVNVWIRGDSQLYNNVFVLDENMKTIGELEDIAPGESIYSARFMGDRLYMVTFKRIDPLFVIDLSSPRNPKILGELKIPGYSDYLHPYDENHIIGIGKETQENEWGGVSTGGVKLSLFDVSDVSRPKQVDKYEIGEPGTDSEALRDHKAFLFDKEKSLLVIPIREVKGRYKTEYGYYTSRIWQGAYVFEVTENGFKKAGTITHEDAESDEYYWNSPSAVRRSGFFNNELWTLSAKMLKWNDLDGLEELNSKSLPYTKNNYWRYRWY